MAKRVAFPTTRRSPIMLKLFRHTYHGIHFGRNAESNYMQDRAYDKKQACRDCYRASRPFDFFRTRAVYTSESICWRCKKPMTRKHWWLDGELLCKECFYGKH